MKTITVQEITPFSHRCGVGLCPAVFDADDGTFFIIGKVVDDATMPEEVKKKIGEGETVVQIPNTLILDLLKENDRK